MRQLYPIWALGFASLIIQTTLFRELFASANGNELVFAFSFALWLLGCGLGTLFFSWMSSRLRQTAFILVFSQLCLMVLFPLTILLIRTCKVMLDLPSGKLLDPYNLLLIGSLAIFPSTFLLGGQFPLLSKYFRSSNNTYIGEAVGSAVAGLLFSFILLFFFNAWQIAALTVLILALAWLVLPVPRWLKLLSLIGAAGLLLFANQLDFSSHQLTWGKFKLLRAVDSPCGRIAVIQDGPETNYFLDGGLLASTANLPKAEELVQLSFWPNPDQIKNVLLVGDGLCGTLQEILKFPVQSVVYLESDPQLLKIIPHHYPEKVKIDPGDGVYYLKNSQAFFDLIILNLPPPTTAFLNRYYTQEFFSTCRQHLTPVGHLVFLLPASADFVGPESRTLSASLYRSAALSFTNLKIIPGNAATYCVAGRAPLKFIDRPLTTATTYFNRSALAYALRPDRRQQLTTTLLAWPLPPINQDLRPISYYFSLLLWASYFHSPLESSLAFWGGSPKLILIAFFLFWFILFSIFHRQRDYLLLGLVGFTALAAQLIILLTLQSLYGYVFQLLGFISALFMAGLAGGGYLGARFTLSRRWLILLLIVIFGGLLAGLTFAWLISPFFLALVSLGTSCGCGAIFTLTVKHSPNPEKTASRLYAADLGGSALAALVSGLWFFPLFGLPLTVIVIIALLSFGLLLT